MKQKWNTKGKNKEKMHIYESGTSSNEFRMYETNQVNVLKSFSI